MKPLRVRLKEDYYSPFGKGPFSVVDQSARYYVAVPEQANDLPRTNPSDLCALPKDSYEPIVEQAAAKWKDVTEECDMDGPVMFHCPKDGGPIRSVFMRVWYEHVSSGTDEYRLVKAGMQGYFRVERKVSHESA